MKKSTRPRTGHTATGAEPVTLRVTREEFERLVDQLNDAECLIGTVEAAIRHTLAHEGSTLRQALRAVENVASDLDAAIPRQVEAAA